MSWRISPIFLGPLSLGRIWWRIGLGAMLITWVMALTGWPLLLLACWRRSSLRSRSKSTKLSCLCTRETTPAFFMCYYPQKYNQFLHIMSKKKIAIWGDARVFILKNVQVKKWIKMCTKHWVINVFVCQTFFNSFIFDY